MMVHCRLAAREFSRRLFFSSCSIAESSHRLRKGYRLRTINRVAVLLVAVFCVSLTANNCLAEEDSEASAPQETSTPADSGSVLSLAHVPPNPEFFIALRPNEVFDRELLKIFQRYTNLDGQNYHPVSITHIEEVMFANEHLEEGQTRSPSTLRYDVHLFRSDEPVDWDEFKANAEFDFDLITLQDVEYLKLTGHYNVAFWPVDDYTYIAGPEEGIRRAIERHVAQQEIPPPTAWPGVGQSQLVIFMASDKLANQLGVGGSNPAMGALKGILEGSDTFAMALHMDEESSLPMNLKIIMGCPDKEMVPEKLKSLGGLSFFLRQMLMADKKKRDESGLSEREPALSDSTAELFKNMTREQVGDSAAVLTLSADVDVALATAFLLSFIGDASNLRIGSETIARVQRASEPKDAAPMAIPPGVLNSPKMVARREASAQRMLGIIQAIKVYAAEHGQPPTFSSNSEGQPLLSWRVHLLPALGYEDLYKQFHLDEAWDSEHNRTLLSQMPAEYAAPSTGDQPSGGEVPAMHLLYSRMNESSESDAAVSPPRFLLIEARGNTPWTQPQEMELDENGKLVTTPRGWQPGGMMVCRPNGTVDFILTADVVNLVIPTSAGQAVSE